MKLRELRARLKRLFVRREYKDRLFIRCFREKEDLLELYNAINGTHYTDPEGLEVTTLEDGIYMSMKNDISFILSWDMNLYEHQSTYNPNMPIRGLLYFARLYEAYIEKRGLDIYGKEMIRLPLPRFIVFYNGTDNLPDQQYVRLSDCFAQSVNGVDGKDGRDDQLLSLECIALMMNINYGHNKELMHSCKRLHDYSYFVETVRQVQGKGGGIDVKTAIRVAMDECIDQGVLKDLLVKHRSEVFDMLLTEFDEKKYKKRLYEDGKKDGRKEGKEEGILVARQDAVLELLEDIGDIPQDLQDRIHAEEDSAVLSKWHKLAARAESIENFQKKIEK